MRNVFERQVVPMGFGSPDDQSDFNVKRLILLDEGAVNPSAETIASISDAAVARKREQLASEVAAQERAEYERSPAGRMERAEKLRDERQAREAKAELARDFLVDTGQLARDEADELDTQEASFAARFEEKEFSAMSVEEQNRFYEENPDKAAAEEARIEREMLLDRWNGMDLTERAFAAAAAGADSIAEVEAELERRGREFSPIAGHVAAEKAFETAKEES